LTASTAGASSSPNLGECAAEFFARYLAALSRQMASFPRIDRVFLPSYAQFARKGKVFVSQHRDIALHLGRGAKKPSFQIVESDDRVEVAAGLPFGPGRSCLSLMTGARRNSIQGLLFYASNLPKPRLPAPRASWVFPAEGKPLEFQPGCDLRCVDVVFVFGSPRTPTLLNPALLWFFTGDATSQLTSEEAGKLAEAHWVDMLTLLARNVDPSRVSVAGAAILVTELSKVLENFRLLVARTDADEQEIHSFIEDHQFILDPSLIQLNSKLGLGKEFQTDFAPTYADGTFRFVEIEPARDPIMTGDSLSARALHAVNQVRSWQDWMVRNQHMSLSTPKLPHWVIIGLRARLEPAQRGRLQEINANLSDIQVRGFDELESNFQTWLGPQLESFRRRAGNPAGST
jgi:hypothetical protein